MKLRKALDKAKKERNDLDSHVGADSSKGLDSTFIGEDDQLSQIYSESRHVDLDQKVLKKKLCASYFTDSSDGDLYKAIRTQIVRRMQDHGWRTLLITSALAGEGKSLTTINLAITFAKELHRTVLLVDADLRRQNIHKCLGYKSNAGLAEYLVNDAPLQELITRPGIEKLSIISGGQTVGDSTEIISSQKMGLLMDEMKNRYKDRFIIFDSPPILTCPDTIAFAPLVDAVVMVVEADKTSAEDVKKANVLLPAEKFLGFILNKSSSFAARNYGYY